MASVYGERIARLEERMDEMEATMSRIETKLDDLLELKHKGAGAFWFVSLIFAASVMGYSILSVFRYFR